MKYTFTYLLMLFSIVNSSLIELFENWALKHNINIKDKLTYNHLFKNWQDNHNYIIHTNNQNLTYKLDHNAYSGYSSDEFANLMGFKQIELKKTEYNINTEILMTLPLSVDWRNNGVVNPVRDQGYCGSCWAFSTIATVESAIAIKTGKLYSLSEQELVDCDNLLNGGKDHGCNGGLMDNAFSWIGKVGGVCTRDSYPYVSGTTQTSGTCKQQTCSLITTSKVISYVDVQQNSDNAMMTALSLKPVAVAIEADQKAFQLYSSGVFTTTCGTNLDHGVVLVGYGNMNGLDYYILRNSWGTSWGVNGYMYLGRGSQYNNGAGQCGVLGQGSYPIV